MKFERDWQWRKRENNDLSYIKSMTETKDAEGGPNYKKLKEYER